MKVQIALNICTMQHKWLTNSRVFFRSGISDCHYDSLFEYDNLPPIDAIDFSGKTVKDLDCIDEIIDYSVIDRLLADRANYKTNVEKLTEDKTEYLFKIDRDYSDYRMHDYPITNKWFVASNGNVTVNMQNINTFIVSNDIFEFISRLYIEHCIDKQINSILHKEAKQSCCTDMDEPDGYLFPVVKDPHGLWQELNENMEPHLLQYIRPYYERCIENGYKQYWHKQSIYEAPDFCGYYCGDSSCDEYIADYINHRPTDVQ